MERRVGEVRMTDLKLRDEIIVKMPYGDIPVVVSTRSYTKYYETALFSNFSPDSIDVDFRVVHRTEDIEEAKKNHNKVVDALHKNGANVYITQVKIIMKDEGIDHQV